MPTPDSALRRLVTCGCVVILLTGTRSIAAADPPRRDGDSAGGTIVLRSHIEPVGAADSGAHLPAAGLVTTRAPDIVREQLGLPRGRGLVVVSVAPDSRASRAGICRHDVLVALDGQWLILPEHFQELLDTAADDAALECRLIRGGKPLVVSLSGRPAATTAATTANDDRPRPAAPAAVADAPQAPPDAPAGLRPDAPAALRPTPPAADGPRPDNVAPSAPATHDRPIAAAVGAASDSSLVQADADYTIKLTPGAGLRLVVQDRRGRVVFNGPIDTPAQRAKMPLAVRTRVESLERVLAERAPPPATVGQRLASRAASKVPSPNPAPAATPAAASREGTPATDGPADTPPALPVAPVEIR
ncbi:MAG: hypothetical protein ACKOCW_11820 [Planctomycetaceae bacterium]